MARTVMVTGAAGALGRAVADWLGTAGWRVVGVDLGAVADEKLALACGGVDLADEAAVLGVIARVEAELGGLDALVNVAGGFEWETIADGSVETWERMFAINVRTALVTCRSVIPLLTRSSGAIVNVGAAAASRAALGMGAYAAAKSGVARLTEALAEELKEAGVRVNAVLPSILDTARNRADMPDAPHDRWVTPRQLAGVVAFLLSPDAQAITGATIPVTGRL